MLSSQFQDGESERYSSKSATIVADPLWQITTNRIAYMPRVYPAIAPPRPEVLFHTINPDCRTRRVERKIACIGAMLATGDMVRRRPGPMSCVIGIISHLPHLNELAGLAGYDAPLNTPPLVVRESQAIRQLLGHTALPVFVGDIQAGGTYRPE